MQRLTLSVLLAISVSGLLIAVCEAGIFSRNKSKQVQIDPEVAEMEWKARRKERILERYAEYEQLNSQTPEDGENDDKVETVEQKSDPNREFFKDIELSQEQNDIINDYKVHVKSLVMDSLFPSETLTNLVSYIGSKTRLSLALDEGLSFDRPSIYTYVAISRLDEAKLKDYVRLAGMQESDLVDSCKDFFQQRSKYAYSKPDPSALVKAEIPVEQFIVLAKANIPVHLLAYEALLANSDVFILESYSKVCMLTEAKDQIGPLGTLF